jgi:hypothetical protein
MAEGDKIVYYGRLSPCTPFFELADNNSTGTAPETDFSPHLDVSRTGKSVEIPDIVIQVRCDPA